MEFLRYIKSECYRTAHRKVLYGFVGGCWLALLAMMLVSFFANRDVAEPALRLHLEDTFPLISALLPTMGMYAILFTAHVAFADEHRQQTLKNTVSYGVPRGSVFFGKLLTGLWYSVLVLAAVMAAILGLGFLFLGVGDGEVFVRCFRGLLWCLLGSFPLWVAALSLAMMLFSVVRSSTGASFLYLGLVTLTQVALSILDEIGYSIFGRMKVWLISVQLSNACTIIDFGPQMARAWVSGAAYSLVFCLAGWAVFRRMEIK